MLKKLNMKKILILSVLFHIVASIFSTGFHHFDEQFQIYEFLNYKLEKSPSSDLPWEFREMVRPWFQVYIYWFVTKASNLIGIINPFSLAFIFRLLTSLFGVFALYTLIPHIKNWIKDEKYQTLTFALLNFSWFIPYIQTRTNAESVSASFFIIGFSYFLDLTKSVKNKESYYALLSGLFLGASYAARYQLALMVAFLWFWGIFSKKVSYKALTLSAFTIAIGIIGSVAIDYLGYGKWTFAPQNLFTSNFTDGRLEGTGLSPWWYYFKKTFLNGIPLISGPIILATLLGWKKFWRHPLTWATLPIIIFHTIIGHKELRYIFPVIILAPLYVGLLINEYSDKFTVLWSKGWARNLIKFTVGLNFLILVISIFRPANPAVNFYKFIYDNDKISTIKTTVENPFTMLGLNINFYKKENLQVQEIKDYKKYITKGSDTYLFFNKGRHVLAMENEPNCKSVYMAYPRWSLNFNVGNWISRSRVWSLYYCN